jgi:DNA-binding MarR family transcriptional regulator
MGSHAYAITDPNADAAAVLVALRRIIRMLRLVGRDAETRHQLSSAQLFVLHSLQHAPAGSLAELAGRTFTDQSSVSTVVSKLVGRKLVVRKPAADRRRVELRLSPAGHRIVQTSPSVPQASIADAVRTMPARVRGELVRSLERLVSAVGASEIAPHLMFEDEPARSRRGRR